MRQHTAGFSQQIIDGHLLPSPGWCHCADDGRWANDLRIGETT
jgi:hypothetical protein